MSGSPKDLAEQHLHTIDVAHSRLKQAWQHRPEGDLQTSATNTGRIATSHIPDPAYEAAATLEHARTRVLTIVTEHTAELADIDVIATNPAPVWRARRIEDLLALHRQWSAQLLTHVRRLQADPARWDDANSMTGTLAAVAQQIHRTSLWAHRLLTQPDAPPDLRVCDNDQCQQPATDNKLLCRTHTERAERAAHMAEQRRRQVAADRANNLRCHGQLRDCDAMLSDADRRLGAANCGACRTWKSREVKKQRQQVLSSDGHVAWSWQDPM